MVNRNSLKEFTGCDRIGLAMTSRLWRCYSHFSRSFICPYAAYPTVLIRIIFESPVSQIKGVMGKFPFDWLQDITLVRKCWSLTGSLTLWVYVSFSKHLCLLVCQAIIFTNRVASNAINLTFYVKFAFVNLSWYWESYLTLT